jgi:hypothetical protein
MGFPYGGDRPAMASDHHLLARFDLVQKLAQMGLCLDNPALLIKWSENWSHVAQRKSSRQRRVPADQMPV